MPKTELSFVEKIVKIAERWWLRSQTNLFPPTAEGFASRLPISS